jgi:hypothetical protein
MKPVDEETLVDSPTPKNKRKTTKPKRVEPKEEMLKGKKAVAKKRAPKKKVEVVEPVVEPVEEADDESTEPEVVEKVVPKKRARKAPVTKVTKEDPIEIGKEVSEATEESGTETSQPPLKKVKVDEEGEPPAWFKKYVEGVKKEENTLKVKKSSKKVVKKDAHETASKKWKEPLTRGRVENEVSNHMSRMYTTMFGRQLR